MDYKQMTKELHEHRLWFRFMKPFYWKGQWFTKDPSRYDEMKNLMESSLLLQDLVIGPGQEFLEEIRQLRTSS